MNPPKSSMYATTIMYAHTAIGTVLTTAAMHWQMAHDMLMTKKSTTVKYTKWAMSGSIPTIQ
jgi:hypothetical protein